MGNDVKKLHFIIFLLLIVSKIYSQKQKISGILKIYRQLNIDEITRIEIEKHHNKALEILNSFDFITESTVELRALMDEMLSREK